MNSQAPAKETIMLEGPAGHIEGLLEIPAETDDKRVALLCHPHPLHQGTMLNKVVHTLARAMNDLGIPAVRFNFRGVGASEGQHDDGNGEMDDLLAVVEWSRQRYPAAAVWLGGFSFGAAVAARTAGAAEASQLIGIAPQVARLRLLTDGEPGCPWLIVQGSADDIVSCDELLDWVNAAEPGAELVVIPDVGHFFHGHLVQLRETLVSNLAEAAS